VLCPLGEEAAQYCGYGREDIAGSAPVPASGRRCRTGPAHSARACEKAGLPRIRVYDFRHANATMMIKARVPLAEAARRLGHSVETLVSTYIGAMDGHDAEANGLIGRVLGSSADADHR
jgi:integrase